MRYSRNELRTRVFRVADRIALEKGVAAVGVEAIHRETGGGRTNVSNGVKAWKTLQEARAADLPVSLRLMAKRLAEEAWILALIARGAEQPEAGPTAPAEPPAKPVLAKPPRTAPAKRDGGEESRVWPAILRRAWAGAKNPKFAEAVAEVLGQVGHPLFPRELEACGSPPSSLPDFSPKHPGRAIARALAGSRIAPLKNGSLWFDGEKPPPRPRKKRHQRVNTDLAGRRRQSPVLIRKAVAFIEKRWPKSVHYSEIWTHVDAPEEFDKPWLRHALRDIILAPGATIKRLGKGNYIANDAPASKRAAPRRSQAEA